MRVSPGHSLLPAAVEEVGDVRVLLGLGDVELPQPVRARATSASVSAHLLLGERDRAVEVVAVARHRRQVDAVARAAAASSWRARSGRKLKKMAASRPVEPRPAPSDDRLDELVRDAARRSSPARPRRDRPRCVALASTIAPKRALGPLPALVPVHRVVAAATVAIRARRAARRDRARRASATRRGRR